MLRTPPDDLAARTGERLSNNAECWEDTTRVQAAGIRAAGMRRAAASDAATNATVTTTTATSARIAFNVGCRDDSICVQAPGMRRAAPAAPAAESSIAVPTACAPSAQIAAIADESKGIISAVTAIASGPTDVIAGVVVVVDVMISMPALADIIASVSPLGASAVAVAIFIVVAASVVGIAIVTIAAAVAISPAFTSAAAIVVPHAAIIAANSIPHASAALYHYRAASIAACSSAVLTWQCLTDAARVSAACSRQAAASEARGIQHFLWPTATFDTHAMQRIILTPNAASPNQGDRSCCWLIVVVDQPAGVDSEFRSGSPGRGSASTFHL